MQHRIESDVFDIVNGLFFCKRNAANTKRGYVVMLPFDTLCHDVMYCMLNFFDRWVWCNRVSWKMQFWGTLHAFISNVCVLSSLCCSQIGTQKKYHFLDFVHPLIINEARRFGSRLFFCLQARKHLNCCTPQI
jgi:hypothetical protein